MPSSSQESDISLPSPDRVANLWRFDQTPAKLQAVSEGRVTVPPRHCAEANVDGDEKLEERDLSMGSESNISGEREFSNVLGYCASHNIGSRHQKDENLSRSGSLEEARDNSAGEVSGGQVEQDEHGDLFSSRSLESRQDLSLQGNHIEDISVGDTLAHFQGSSHGSMPQRETEQEGVLGGFLRDVEHEEQLYVQSQDGGDVGVADQEPEEQIEVDFSGVREADVEGGLELDHATELLIKSQEAALEVVNTYRRVGDSQTRPGRQLLEQCSQESRRIWETNQTPSREILEAGGKEKIVETPKTDGGVKRTVSEANFDIDLDNMESDYDLESGKTPGEQHFGGKPSSHFDAPGNLDDTVPFDETISDPQMHSRVLKNISISSRLSGAQEMNSGRHGSSNSRDIWGCRRTEGAASGTKSASTAWSLPMRGLLSGRKAGDNYTSSTPQSRSCTSSTPQANCVPSTPAQGKGCNFSTSTPIRQGNGTPQAPQWSPRPSQAMCGARGDSFQVQSIAAVTRQTPSSLSLAGDAAQMQSSGQGGFLTPSRPRTRYDATPNKSQDDQLNLDSSRTMTMRGVEGEEERVLSIHLYGGRLGAAVYSTETFRLDLMNDLPEKGPDFSLVRTLIQQVEPHYLLVSSQQDPALLSVLRNLAASTNLEVNSTTDTRSVPGDKDDALAMFSLIVRSPKEFGAAFSRRRLMALQVPGYNNVGLEREQMMRLSTFVDFASASMICAAGALLKYLDVALPVGLEAGDGGHVLLIGSLAIQQVLTLDRIAANALQIFNCTAQLSGSKAGSWNKKREGLSLLSLLSRCSSVVGTRHLRSLLRCPSTSLAVLKSRHRAIAFFSAAQNVEVVKALISGLKQVKNFHRIMKKLSGSKASIADWRSLQRTLAGIWQLIEVAPHCRGKVAQLEELKKEATETVQHLLGLIDQVVDFPASTESGSFCVKPCVDDELDDCKRRQHGLPDLLNVVAEEEISRLPREVGTCTVCYIPHVGYLVAMPIKKTAEELGFDYKNIPGYKFMFENNGAMHYRNDCTESLDEKLGDVVLDITEIETRIQAQLTEQVLDARTCLDKAIRACGEVDCLLAMAIVGRENNWVKPDMREEGGLKVRGGRHPLQELSVTQFIANDTNIGEDAARLHLLTGPNSSGKSVYLKQVGLIVFLAHLGSWVPAMEAQVPLTDRLLTRIQTVESISLGMSAFQCDLAQISAALRNSTGCSLLLVDEFGKGTSPEDGEALLAAVAEDLLERGNEGCPLTLLSTHFHGVVGLLGERELLGHFSMKTSKDKEGRLTYLYKLQEGTPDCSSEALAVAARVDLPQDVLERAEELISGEPFGILQRGLPLCNIHDLMDRLLDLDTESRDYVELFLEATAELRI